MRFEDAFRKCTHPRVEEIRNGNGVVLGRQCKTCLELLSGRGTCYGCGKEHADMRVRVSDQLFCNNECKAAGAAKDRKVAQQRRRDPAARPQTEMPWARKDWRR